MLVSIRLFCYVKKIEIIYFDTFGFEHVPKNIKKNIFRLQANNSMGGYFCIGFIDFTFSGKTLIDYTSLFSYDFEKNDNIILSYFENE